MLNSNDTHQFIQHKKPIPQPKDMEAIRNKTQTKLNFTQLTYQPDDSMTREYPKRIHSLGIWNNPREPFTVRVDKGLAKAFVLASKAYFGSTCNPIESYMAAIVGLSQSGWVNPSNTVNIGEIKIERNLRERRKITKTIEIEKAILCEIGTCGKDAVAKLLYVPENKIFNVCADHKKLLPEAHSSFWRYA